MPDVIPLDTSLLPHYESGVDTAVKLGQIGYLNGQRQLAQLNAQQAVVKAQARAASSQLMAAAMDPSATPDATNTTPAQMRASAMGSGPNPLINRTGQTINGVPTLGSIGAPAAAPQASPQAAPASPDMSPAAVMNRYVTLARSKGIPADIIADEVKSFNDSAVAQENELKLKQARRDSMDADIKLQAYQDAGGDPAKTIANMIRAGASPDAVDAVQAHFTKQRQDLATLSKEQLDNQAKRFDSMRGALMAYMALPMLDKTNSWNSFLDQQVANGHLTAEERAQEPPSYPGDDRAKIIANGLATGTQLAKEEIEKRNADHADAELAAQKARDAQNAKPNSEVELALLASDPTKTQQERDTANAALKRLDQSKREARPVNNFVIPSNLQAPGGAPLSGAELLAKLPPATAATVRAVAEGRQSITSASSYRNREQMSGLVNQYDPYWTEQRAQIRKAFTTGVDGRNIGNLNTAAVHLDQLAAIGDAMHNGSFVPGNRIFNAAIGVFGGSAPTNFAGMKAVVAGEMANALKGNATDTEIANIGKAIESSSSPEQLADIVRKTFLPALATKLHTYAERFQAASPGDPWTPVLPSAAGVFERNGIDRTKPTAQYRYTATGAGGHKIGSNDGATWYDVQTGRKVQ